MTEPMTDEFLAKIDGWIEDAINEPGRGLERVAGRIRVDATVMLRAEVDRLRAHNERQFQSILKAQDHYVTLQNRLAAAEKVCELVGELHQLRVTFHNTNARALRWEDTVAAYRRWLKHLPGPEETEDKT